MYSDRTDQWVSEFRSRKRVSLQRASRREIWGMVERFCILIAIEFIWVCTAIKINRTAPKKKVI